MVMKWNAADFYPSETIVLSNLKSYFVPEVLKDRAGKKTAR